MVCWEAVQQWQAEPLFTAIDEFRTRRQQARDLVEQLLAAGRHIPAESRRWNALRASITAQVHHGEFLVGQYAELMMACAAAADSVSRVWGLVRECHECAEEEGLLIHSNGSVSHLNQIADCDCAGAPPGLERGPQRTDPSQEKGGALPTLNEMIGAVLRLAQKTEQNYRNRLDAIANGQMERREGYGSYAPGLADLPDPNWSETEVATWWSAHTPEEKQWLIERHPGVIGNANGVDACSRDRANRIYLDRLISEAERSRIEAIERIKKADPSVEEVQESLNDCRERLADLYIAREAIAEREDRQLLTVDISGRQTHVAIACGDADNADYITTYVPGMGNNVRTHLKRMIRHAENIRRTVLHGHKITHSQIAIITWIGYDTPPTLLEAALPDRAREAIPILNGFLQGIHASRRESSRGTPYMAVLGHSYGSTATGMAMNDIKPGVVNDVILIGSPGAGVGKAYEYNINGNAYVCAIETHDAVRGIGPDGFHGVDPAISEGFIPISNEARPVKNPLNPYDRHNSYLLLDQNKKPTPILIDISNIIIGEKDSLRKREGKSAEM